MAAPKRVYTVAEVAELLRVSQRTVRRLIAGGALSVVRVGKSIRIERRVVKEFVTRGGVQ